MKAAIIIAMWIISLMLMATDCLLQALIALSFFGLSSWLLKKNEAEAAKAMKKFENKIDKLIR